MKMEADLLLRGVTRMAELKAHNIKGPFYSNCFFEAIKAKIRHPFSVKITVVKKSEAGCPHFLWTDGKHDFDFGVERHITGLHILWFEGYIRQRRLGFNKRYSEMMRAKWNRRAGEGT